MLCCILSLLPHGHIGGKFEISNPYLKLIESQNVALTTQNHTQQWITW